MRQVSEILLCMMWLSISQTINELLMSNLKRNLYMNVFMKQTYVRLLILHFLRTDQKLNKLESLFPSYSTVSLI